MRRRKCWLRIQRDTAHATSAAPIERMQANDINRLHARICYWNRHKQDEFNDKVRGAVIRHKCEARQSNMQYHLYIIKELIGNIKIYTYLVTN